MISVICFSKDRPLQLEAYIESLMFYSGISENFISILYTETDGISYASLLGKYPSINWIRESAFRNDLLGLVDSSSDYILFGCDDVFFTDHFDLNAALSCLNEDSTIFGFSLRLGLNLHSIPNIRLVNGIAYWEWQSAAKGNWSYPWDVSASIYRRDFVYSYLNATPGAKNPNHFEAILAEMIGKKYQGIQKRLACFERSKCLTLTVNRVQDEFANEFDGSQSTEVVELYSSFSAGKYLDWPKFHNTKNRIIHVDSSYFSLTDQISPPYPKLEVMSQSPKIGLHTDAYLRMRILFWKYFIGLKENVRPWLPRRVMQFLRTLMRGL